MNTPVEDKMIELSIARIERAFQQDRDTAYNVGHSILDLLDLGVEPATVRQSLRLFDDM
jgi:hypothetical protein